MTVQYHYVVVATMDADGDITFSVDDETAMVNFSDELLFDDESGEWRAPRTNEEESNDEMFGFVLRNLIQGEHRGDD